MKIDRIGLNNPVVTNERESGVKAEPAGRRFASDLLANQDNNAKQRLDALLQEINRQGERLGKVPTYSELKKYRELVRSFIGEAVGRSYTLQAQMGWDRYGRQKMYTTIRQIDDVLAGMAEDVRLGQQGQLAIMAKHDVLRGLLVDLYM